jgi:peptide/nickel transport system ATP-binding protein
MSSPDPLLDVRGLRVSFGSAAGREQAVRGLDLSISEGESVALVGESGCGKSTAALALMRLLPDSAACTGQILFAGRHIPELSAADMRGLRGRSISMIFQEPMSSLNPVHRVGDQIVEVLRAHEPLSRDAARRRAVELLERVQIAEPARRFDDYPHQLSGGQRQRVMIAIAIACGPRLLIADEPTTALDVTVQAQVLALLDRLRRELRMALLLITHDLGVVAEYADRVLVMLDGSLVEEAPTQRLFEAPAHHYSRQLLAASLHCQPPPVAPPGVARPAVPREDIALLRADRLVVAYPRTRSARANAVDGVSFSIAAGETLGLIGESGCGKSTLARALMRLIPLHAGTIHFQGKEVGALRERALGALRQRVQMVFQDPYGSLNPRQSVGRILDTVLVVNRYGDAGARASRIDRLIERVGLPADSRRRHPNEFSGGQRQRIAIARALLVEPALLILDEPVSALDVSIQAQILDLLLELRRDLGLAYLFISHDLAVVRRMSDRVVVMRDGRFVEEGANPAIWEAPRHAYTQSLMAAMPRVRWRVAVGNQSAAVTPPST